MTRKIPPKYLDNPDRKTWPEIEKIDFYHFAEICKWRERGHPKCRAVNGVCGIETCALWQTRRCV